MSRSVVELERVTVRYRTGRRRGVGGVTGVSMSVATGQRVGLVGASGAGKSTIAALVVGLLTPDSGTVRVAGASRAEAPGRAGTSVQLVSQDPYSSLAPHATVGWSVAEPLRLQGDSDHRRDWAARAAAALAEVGLDPAVFADRHPHELSGGERQRVALARAMVARPALVVADEPTQMVDVLARAELLDLMQRIAHEHATAWLYITHDLGVASTFCERLVVLDEGRIVESGPTAQVLTEPTSDAAARLVAAAI